MTNVLSEWWFVGGGFYIRPNKKAPQFSLRGRLTVFICQRVFGNENKLLSVKPKK